MALRSWYLPIGVDGHWTYYWSYTNLAFLGKLVLDGKEYRVTGKGWFDKQGGPYKLFDRCMRLSE
jgi:predicted secreted hydrolase